MSIFEMDMIGAYELFFMVAVAVGLAIAWASGRGGGALGPEWPAVLGLTLTAGIVGARTLHFDPGALSGAKTILGGVLLGSLALFLGIRFLRLHSRSADALAVALPVGFAIGRVGCLLVGCCFGHPTDLPWGVVYDAHSAAFREQLASGLLIADSTTSLPIHPTQMYEALVALLVAASTPWQRRVLRRGGSLLLGVLLLLCVGRLLVEFLRVRELAPFMGMTEVQWLLAGLALAIGVLLVYRERSVVDEVAPQLPTEVSRIRIACLAALPVVVLIASGSTFAQIERLALAAAAIPSLLALAERSSLFGVGRSRLPWKRLPVSLAMVAVVLQQPEGDPGARSEADQGYPRTDWTVGISYGEQYDQDTRVVGQEWDESVGCDGGYRDITDEFRLHYRMVGANAARTRRSGATRSTTIRLMGFAGSEDAMNSSGQTTTTTLGGLGSVFTFEDHPVAMSGGAAFGRFAAGNRARAILGVRIGSSSGLHAQFGYNDIEPQGGEESTTHAGVGYAFGTSGWAIRGGREFQDDHSFLGATLPFRNLLIEPTVFLAESGSTFENKTVLRVTATYRFQGRVPPQ